MNISDTTLEIRTLGSFCISVNGRPVVIDWPDETLKVLFCSLLSPLDVSFTWDRICRSLWDIPATKTSMQRLEELFFQKLDSFLIKELGFNPLITAAEGISINRQCIQVDAHEFHSLAVDGLRLFSLGNNAAAFEKFSRADALYTGCYLPGMPGRINTDTRYNLEELYRISVKDAMHQTRKSVCLWHIRRAEPRMRLAVA
jgi:hypothetical protein